MVGAREGLHVFLLLSADLFKAGACQMSRRCKGTRLDEVEVFPWWQSIHQTRFPSHQMPDNIEAHLHCHLQELRLKALDFWLIVNHSWFFLTLNFWQKELKLEHTAKVYTFGSISMSFLHFYKTASSGRSSFISSHLWFWQNLEGIS